MNASFGFLLFLMAMFLPAIFALKRSRELVSTKPVPSAWLLVIGLLPGLLFFLLLQGPPHEVRFLLGLGLLAIAILAVFFWVREFIHLMGLADEAFPGRYDKVLWFLLLVLLPPVGALAFSTFRRAYWPVVKPVRDSAAHDFL